MIQTWHDTHWVKNTQKLCTVRKYKLQMVGNLRVLCKSNSCLLPIASHIGQCWRQIVRLNSLFRLLPVYQCICAHTHRHTIYMHMYTEYMVCVQWLRVKINKNIKTKLNSEPCNISVKFDFFPHKAATDQKLLLYPLNQTHLKKLTHSQKNLEKCSNVNSVLLRLFLTSFWEKKFKQWGELKELQHQIEWNNMNVTQELLNSAHFEEILKTHLFLKERNGIVQYTNITLSSNVMSDISGMILFCRVFEISFFCYLKCHRSM